MRPPWFKDWLIRALLMGVSLSFLLVKVPTAQADPANGEKLFKKKSCPACHSIGGKGGKVGPALDGVASRHDKTWLTQQIKDPKANNPEAKMLKLNMPEADIQDLLDYLMTLK